MTLALPPNHSLSPTVNLIHETARDLEAAYKIAQTVCPTDLVPARFKNKPEDAAVAILSGAPLGMHPLQSLHNIFPIHGQPAMYARTMAAILMSLGHKLWTVEESDTAVTVAGRRRGEDKVEQVTFTIEEATKAGYAKQNAKYASDPRSMLYARALSIVCRRVAPDALLGMAYSAEELLEQEPGEYVAAESSPLQKLRPQPAAPVTAAEILERGDAAASEDRTAEAEPPAERIETGVDRLITEAQMTKLFAVMGEFPSGVRGKAQDRQVRLDALSQCIGRKVDSSKDLTRDEASVAIQVFEDLKGRGENDAVIEFAREWRAEQERAAAAEAADAEPPAEPAADDEPPADVEPEALFNGDETP